jgi:hypothetical protein
MAYQFSLVINSKSIELLEKLVFFLVRETRPLFAEDVAEVDKALFLSIEILDYPSGWRIEDNNLWLDWFEVDDFGVGDIKCLLDLEGIELVIAFEIPDDPMSLDTEEGCWFWVEAGGRLKRVDRKKALELCSDKIVNTFSD